MNQRLPGTRLQKATGAALLLALGLGGCVSAPSTQPLVTQTSPQSLGLGSTAAPRFPDAWWRAFGDPQIDRLAEEALKANPSLQGALARIRAAQAELSASRALDYPQISLDGQVQRQLLSNRYILPSPYGGSWQWTGDVQARMNWSLDFWGRQAALIDKARGNAEAAGLDAFAARLALAGTFAQTYINLSLAYQNIDVANQTVADRQTILNLTQSRVKAGLENEAALEQAKALLAMARMEVRRSEAARDVGIHAIAALIGQGATAYGTITRPSASLETALPLPASLPADLLSRRPDILAARLRITGEVREAAWTLIALQAERAQAEAQVRALRDLADDVERRVRAGDLARADALVARADLLNAGAREAEARQRLLEAHGQWTVLTGLDVLPGATQTGGERTPATGVDIAAHPELLLAAQATELARRRVEVARSSRRDPPEIALGLRQEVPARGELTQNSVAIGLRLPFGTDDRYQPLQAAALSELDVAQAREQRLRARLDANASAARAALRSADRQLADHQARAELLRERAQLIDKSFRAGESPLPELLRALDASAQADAALVRQQAALGLAGARIQQSLGLLP